MAARKFRHGPPKISCRLIFRSLAGRRQSVLPLKNGTSARPSGQLLEEATSLSPAREGVSAITAYGPSLHFAATQQFGRFRSEADIERFSVCTEPVTYDPKPTLTPRI